MKNHLIPSNKELDKISKKLSLGLIKTLNLDIKEKVFIGNEEKLFLLLIAQKLPNSMHKTAVKFNKFDDLNYFRFLDIANDELLNRAKVKNRQNLEEKARGWLIKLRGLLINTMHRLWLKKKLKYKNNIIHYAAHMRYGSFVTPNLTNLYLNVNIKKNIALRKAFEKNLIDLNLDKTLIKYLVHLFPTSHLELYKDLVNHPIVNNYNFEKIITTIYGVMDDPLLSFITKKNKSKLIYVQHGGGYGLSKDHQAWQIEEDGAEKMFFWGTGDNNVYPTRYRNKYFSKMNTEILIILEDKKNYQSIKPFIKLSENINTNLKKRCIVVSHPNGPSFKNKNIQKGVGYRQHEKAQLVIYDRITQSLLYARILSKRPFLVVEDNTNKVLTPTSENAFKFLSLLKEVGILVSTDELNDSVNFWGSFAPNEASEIFGQKVQPFLDHVLGQPKIETLFEV